MDIQQIKYFLALAKELHFWNTASKMNITQSALSRHIQALESELEVQLFYRDKRNVALTPSGVFLQQQWSEQLCLIESFHHAAKQIHLGESGSIKIAHPDSISSCFIPQFLKRIIKAYANLKIELIQLPYQIQEDYLKDYKVDIVLSRDTCDSLLIQQRILDKQSLTFVVAKDHHFKSLKDITKESLAQEKLILTTSLASSSYTLLIDKVLKSYNVAQAPYIQCEFGSAIVALVRSGLGISILPESYQLNQYEGVRFITIPYETDLYIQWRKDDPNPILKNILAFV
jgi:DNA-binding transcriptional LysR family regulator